MKKFQKWKSDDEKAVVQIVFDSDRNKNMVNFSIGSRLYRFTEEEFKYLWEAAHYFTQANVI